ncbi:cysteine desulfurase family protein [Shouchella shacheensis]|uniref:cysteine desulfurase family protein n=1 Tax=Shouchella shacheensis TaxID=1649580 RepID=UPI00073FE0EB|nr:cysteine desulfurase family protein [Shouchella shacheensis]
MPTIYLDHAATSPLHSAALDEMLPYFTEVFGNASSVHSYGRKARAVLEQARADVADLMKVKPSEIVFTSGGTEANNIALIGYALANQEMGTHLITTEVEHHAVLHTMDELEHQGFRVTRLPVDGTGRIRPKDLEAALTKETILVSIMYGNNEVGTIQPLDEVAALLSTHQAVLHTDAVQAAGTQPLVARELGVDLMSIASHKLNGPKGVGCLYIREGLSLAPLHFGGEQERKRRAGTENVPGVVGFAKAFRLASEEREERSARYQLFYETFVSVMKEADVEFVLNGDASNRLSHILNVSFPGVSTETLLMQLDLEGIAASGGSACTAGTLKPSHVIQAMTGEDERVQTAVRFSFGYTNTLDDVEAAFRRVAQIVKGSQESTAFID